MNILGAEGPNAPGLRWLFIDMNSFFASCEQQENTALRGQPVAVLPTMADTTCVIAASYEAKAFGVKTGTMVREAKQLCPGLRFVTARPKLYVTYHHRILKAIETCLPVEDVLSIDEAACRLDRLQQEPSAARALALAVKAAIHEHTGVCLTSSIGIAANKFLAKLASNMQKPDGLTLLHPANLPRAILHLGPDALTGIGPSMMARLRRAGIVTMADLWAADTACLRRIWGGINGVRFHALLHGADLPEPAHPRRSLGHQHVLPPEERTLARAAPVARQLLVRAAQRLRDEGFYCQRLSLAIKWSQAMGHYVREQTFRETQDTRFLLRILMSLWSPAPLLKPLRIGVTLADLTPCTAHQPDLFDKPKTAALTTVLDRINERYGHGTIAYGSFLPAMSGKIAFRRVPGMNEF